ncbi:MAG: ParB N-terminal domain-containing protein [Syntrophobacteraceae bacterium]|nr:ParB N-terminal domain-containing protein [Syntrophobacteraceae bacterium]
MTDDIFEIEIKRISPNRRIVYSEESIEEIGQILRHGELEPVLIRFDYDSFRIVDGEKRFRACKRLGMTTIRAVIVA